MLKDGHRILQNQLTRQVLTIHPRRHFSKTLTLRSDGYDSWPIPPSWKPQPRPPRPKPVKRGRTQGNRSSPLDFDNAPGYRHPAFPVTSERDRTGNAEFDHSPDGSSNTTIINTPRVVLSNTIESRISEEAPVHFGLDLEQHFEDQINDGSIASIMPAQLYRMLFRIEPLELIWQAIDGLIPPDDLNPSSSILPPRGPGGSNYSLHLGHEQKATLDKLNAVPLHHSLLHLNYPISKSSILPDGTDNRFLPGPSDLWKCRVWAAGSLTLHNKNVFGYPKYVPPTYHVLEQPVHLRLTGQDPSRKAFVTIRKSFYQLNGFLRHEEYNAENVLQHLSSRPGYGKKGKMRSGPLLEEEYTFCFSQEPPNFSAQSTRVIKAPDNPQFEHTLIPDRHLLFCWSAITYNAHLIHLDPSFARSEYGVKNLLVHGPLTVFLAIEWAQRRLTNFALQQGLNTFHITNISYKNLQPLYVDEPMFFRMKAKKRAEEPGTLAEEWTVWIEKEVDDSEGKATRQRTLAFKADIKLKLGNVPAGQIPVDRGSRQDTPFWLRRDGGESLSSVPGPQIESKPEPEAEPQSSGGEEGEFVSPFDSRYDDLYADTDDDAPRRR